MFRKQLESIAAAEKAALFARTLAIARASETSTTTTTTTSSSSSFSSPHSSAALASAESSITLLQREILTTTRDAQSLSLAASQQLDDKVNELNATRSLLLVLQEKLQKAREDKKVFAEDTNMSSSSSIPTLPPSFLIYAQSIDSRVQGVEMVKERLEKGLEKLQTDFHSLSVSSERSNHSQQKAHAAFVDLAGVSASLIEQVDQQKVAESHLQHEIHSLKSSLASASTTISSNAGMIELQRAKLISQSVELDLAKETIARRSAHVLTCQDIITQQEAALNKLRSELLGLRSESDSFGDRLKHASQLAASELASKNAELLALAKELASANNLISKMRDEAKTNVMAIGNAAYALPVAPPVASDTHTLMMEDDSGAALLLVLSGEAMTQTRLLSSSSSSAADMTPTTGY